MQAPPPLSLIVHPHRPCVWLDARPLAPRRFESSSTGTKSILPLLWFSFDAVRSRPKPVETTVLVMIQDFFFNSFFVLMRSAGVRANNA